MIRFTGYGVIAEKQHVGKLGQIFPCTCRKNYIGSKKWMTTFMMGTTSSITMQSLGKIVQRAPAVGAKMWFCFCLFFLARSEFGAPCVGWLHSSKTHCVAIYRQISTRFAAFFRKGLHFQTLHSSHIRR